MNILHDARAHAFEQQRDVEKIVGSCVPDFVGEFRQVRRKRKDTGPGKAGEHQNPRCSEAKWRVVKNTIWHIARPHQLIETRGGARQHVVEVADSKHHAFRFAGSARRVDDGDRVARRERYRCRRRRGSASGHEPAMASRNAASLQQTRPAPASHIMAMSSAGAWRA